MNTKVILLKVSKLFSHQFHNNFSEELRHHSDDEDNNNRSRPQGGSYKQYTHEERKEGEGHDQKRSPHTDQQKKKDYYLYAGEEKPYESDPEQEGQGIEY